MPLRPVDQYDIETEILPYVSGVEGGNGSWNFWCPLHDDEGSEHKGFSLSRKGNKNLGNCRSPQCAAKLNELIDWIESGGSRNGQEEVETIVNVTRVSGKRERQTVKKSGGMEWWVRKTNIPEKMWEQMGAEEYETGIRFLFEGHDCYKIRKPPKNYAWVGTSDAEAPPFWPAPPDELPEHIAITEGESDAGTFQWATSIPTFACTKGAASHLPEGTMDAFIRRGVRELTICSDTDPAGTDFSIRISQQAVTAGLTCNVVRLSEVLDPFSGLKDLNGTWRASGSKRQFLQNLKRATQRVATRFPIVGVNEMLELAAKEMEWMIPSLVAPSDKILISGPQKAYKTWLSLDLGRALAMARPFLNREEWTPTRRYRVLLVQEEGSPQLWARRVLRLGLDKTAREYLHFIHRKGIRFTEPDTIDELIAYCREHQIEYIIFDPLQRMMPGVDENDSSKTGIVWDQIFRIQFALPGIVCCVIHHANKTETLTWESVRGSSRHGGEVDLGIFVARHPLEDNKIRIALDGRDIPQYLGTGETFEARVHISKEGEKPEFEIDASEITVKVNPVKAMGKKNKDLILTAIADGARTIQAIISQTELSENTVRSRVKDLIEEEIVEEHDNGGNRPKTYTVKEDEKQSGED